MARDIYINLNLEQRAALQDLMQGTQNYLKNLYQALDDHPPPTGSLSLFESNDIKPGKLREMVCDALEHTEDTENLLAGDNQLTWTEWREASARLTAVDAAVNQMPLPYLERKTNANFDGDWRSHYGDIRSAMGDLQEDLIESNKKMNQRLYGHTVPQEGRARATPETRRDNGNGAAGGPAAESRRTTPEAEERRAPGAEAAPQAPPAAPRTAAPPDDAPIIRPPDSAGATLVKEIQAMLHLSGHEETTGRIDGIIGPKTRAGLHAALGSDAQDLDFQQPEALDFVHGKLKAHLASNPNVERYVRDDLTGKSLGAFDHGSDRIKAAQAYMNVFKGEELRVDGIYGDKTSGAAKRHFEPADEFGPKSIREVWKMATGPETGGAATTPAEPVIRTQQGTFSIPGMGMQ